MMTLQTGKKVKLNKGFTTHLCLGAGFTLIELVLVILLISILISLSTPLFKRTFSNLELKNASFDMAKLVNYCQEMAIIERANYKLNLDFEEGKFWITTYDSSAEAPIYKRIGGRYGRTFILPNGLIFIGDTREVIFYPDGRSDRVEIGIVDKTGVGRLLGIKGFGSQVGIKEIEK